ncbi:MAG: acetyl-CoA carboxylase biotin carboxylase subunit [Candidatus Aminicenantes bacterium]|nr:acetyl-CoA carboxylase biotin carboxylase subunit [Candidatus Aminicenantes bacterium]
MKRRKIRKVLVANRGEIAVRVQRTCRELGLSTVAVFSDPDRDALHVRYADEAYPLPGSAPRDTYLNQSLLFEVARQAGADAVHPGYGFLSENAAFSAACARHGLVFIGPSAEAITRLGEKTRARRVMEEAGVPVVPGTPPLDAPAEAAAEAARLGFPVLVKAAAGGGGKGMRLVRRGDDLEAAFAACRREALSAFGDSRVYLEKYLHEPHHVEFQILADGHGHVLHLNERECSVQRRHQKIIEETPSPVLTPELRARMGEAAVLAARAGGYTNAGTVEFLVDAERRFYFLEMNTRLQVEHPVTELTTGVDLVERQIRIAEGAALEEKSPEPRGHALECRVYAEDPGNDFLPSPGFIKRYVPPGGPGVRDDTGVYAGFRIPTEYDPLISKLVVWGEDRGRALARMSRALEEYVLTGVRTNISFLRKIVRHPEFQKGKYDTHFVPLHLEELLKEDGHRPETVALAAAAALAWLAEDRGETMQFVAKMTPSAWKMSGRPGNQDR